ncbi:MAG: aldolase/citrate lyase family protein [Mesorhizobium sp.]
MTPNPFRKRYEQNEIQIGTWITTFSQPSILRILKSAGLDFACVDLEHSGLSIESISQLAIVASALEFPIMVRPPSASREWITRLLDIGVWNILCPQVVSAEHAREVADAARFSPAGTRGAHSFGPAMNFTPVDREAWRRFANQQVFIVALLETQSALDDLDAIAATPGIDALMIGPADLAQDLGFGGSLDHAAMRQLSNQVAAAALRHNKKAPTFAANIQDGKAAIEAGQRAVLISSETRVLHDAYHDLCALRDQRLAIPA